MSNKAYNTICMMHLLGIFERILKSLYVILASNTTYLKIMQFALTSDHA
jgi:hypothetical protein